MSFEKIEDYDNEFIIKLLVLLTRDSDYLHRIYDALDVKYFNEYSHQWIVNETLKYYHKYATIPSLEYFNTELKKFKNEDEGNAVIVKETKKIIGRIYNEEFDGLEYVMEEFTSFIREKSVINVLMDSVELVKGGFYNEMLMKLESASNIGDKKEPDYNYKADVGSRYADDGRKVIPFPFPIWNERTQGGMHAGDLILLFAPQGAGKSWLSVILGEYVVELGLNVLYFSLELDSQYIAKRFDAKSTKIPLDELKNNIDKIEEALENQEGELKIIRLKGRNKKLSSIKKKIKSCKRDGFYPDLVVIDYIDLIESERVSKKEDVDDTEHLFNEIRDLGSDEGFPVVSPSQINRSGAKDKIIENDKMAGSYKKGMIADISMSLSRNKEDKAENIARVHWMKNRYGYDGMTDSFEFDTSWGGMEYLGEYVEEAPNGSKLSDKLRKKLLG